MLISTWGVKKCIGGVALSIDRAPRESPLSLYVPPWLPPSLLGITPVDGIIGPGLSKSIPCLRKKKYILLLKIIAYTGC